MINKRQKGFTIIELMVVLAIISVILLIAIPVYQTYRVRVQLSEGLNLVRPMRLAAAEYYMQYGAWPAGNPTVDLKPPEEYETRYVKSIALANQGTHANITITYKIPALGENNTIVLFTELVNGHVIWQCTDGTVLNKYRPPACQRSEG
jgi:type IV pilus assembly protein PilA